MQLCNTANTCSCLDWARFSVLMSIFLACFSFVRETLLLTNFKHTMCWSIAFFYKTSGLLGRVHHLNNGTLNTAPRLFPTGLMVILSEKRAQSKQAHMLAVLHSYTCGSRIPCCEEKSDANWLTQLLNNGEWFHTKSWCCEQNVTGETHIQDW